LIKCSFIGGEAWFCVRFLEVLAKAGTIRIPSRRFLSSARGRHFFYSLFGCQKSIGSSDGANICRGRPGFKSEIFPDKRSMRGLDAPGFASHRILPVQPVICERPGSRVCAWCAGAQLACPGLVHDSGGALGNMDCVRREAGSRSGRRRHAPQRYCSNKKQEVTRCSN
jgi:hypothetical protein